MIVGRWWRWVGGALLALLGLGVLAWLALPGLLKSQAEQRGSAFLGRELRIGAVEFEPWTLKLTLRQLSLGPAPGSADPQPQARIERLFVDVDARSIWERAPVITALQVDAPRLRLARLGDGRFDIDDLIQRLRPDPKAPEGPPARFALFNLELKDGELLLDDRPVARQHALKQLQLTLPFLSNLPHDLAVKVQPRVAFELDGSRFDSGASAIPFADQREADLQLGVQALALAPLAAYLPPSVPLHPQAGTLAAKLVLQFQQPPRGPPRVGLSGTVDVDGLSLAPSAAAASAPAASAPGWVQWRKLHLDVTDARPLARQLSFGTLRVEGLAVDARRDERGRINLAFGADGPAAPARAAVASAPAAASAPAWQVRLQKLELADATLRWRDAGTRPAADLRLQQMNLSLAGLQWPMSQPAQARLEAALHRGEAAQPAGQLTLEGPVSDRAADLAFTLQGLPLAVAEPYLAGVLVPQLQGELAAEGRLDWAAGETGQEKLALQRLQVRDLKLVLPKAPKLPPLAWQSLDVADLALDLRGRSVSIGRLGLSKPAVTVARAADGRWNALDWLVAAPSAPARKPAAAPARAEAPWSLSLAEFKLDGGSAKFSDAATGGAPVALNLDALNLAAGALRWPLPARPAPTKLQLSARLALPAADRRAPPARIEWRGQVSPQPLLANGQLLVERFPVHAVEPYFGAALPLNLQRAEAGWKGELNLSEGRGGFSAGARGDVLLADLRLGSRNSGDELLAWQSLALQQVRVAVAPGQKPLVEIGEAALSDFYARLEITEQGRFNLQDAATPAAGATPATAAASAPVVAASAPASAPAPVPASASVPAPAASAVAAAPGGGLPLDLTVGRLKLSNGTVDFSDRFIRPNYSAKLTELNGLLGRFQSGSTEMAPLELRGRAAGTADLEITGSLNPTVQPLALDIRARATDLELAPLSPYAGKYAGYAIERGKLSMDVQYKIQPDGKLDAKNQVVLNQLTFGDKVDSPDATKLPVLLAVALLKDRNGVIDINLPISGSINDPQFSVFGLVLKVIGNLLVKAITAPFSLLAGGGGEDLSFAEFQPGTAVFTDAGRAVVDKVAKALADRPALKMTVTGASDPASERAAMQASALEARVRAEQRRERLRAGGSADGEAEAPSAAERAQLVKQIYGDTKLPNKPRNLVGLAKDLPVPEMEALLKAGITVSTDTARELALQRGLAVRDALVAKGLPPERLFLAAPKLRASGEDEAAWTPRVQLSLSTQ